MKKIPLNIHNRKQIAAMMGTTAAALSVMGVVASHDHINAHADTISSNTTAVANDNTSQEDLNKQAINGQAAASNETTRQTQARANLHQAVTDARAAGVQITQQPTQAVNETDPNAYKTVTSNAATLEQKQADTINSVTATQNKNIATYNNNTNAINNANASGSTSVSDASKARDAKLQQLLGMGGTVTSNQQNLKPQYVGVNSNDADGAVAAVQQNLNAYNGAVSQARNTINAESNSIDQAINSVQSAKDQNAKMTSDYNQEYVKYLAKVNAASNQPGHVGVPINQQLLMKSEDNSNVSLSSPHDVYSSSEQPFNADGASLYWKASDVNVGDTMVATYTGLKNSTYNNVPVTKLVRTMKVTSSPAGKLKLEVASDPSMGFWFTGGNDDHSSSQTVAVSDALYDANGNQITFGDNAYFSAGSLNHYGLGSTYHVEKVRGDNAQYIQINGSSISKHDDGFAYASDPNDGDWDSPDSPKRWYGATVYKIDNGANTVNYTATTSIGSDAAGATTWFTIDTANLPVIQAPAKPKLVDVPTPNVTATSFSIDQIPQIGKPATLSATYQYTDTYLQPAAAKPTVTVNNHNPDINVNVPPANVNVSAPNVTVNNTTPAPTVTNNVTTPAQNVNVNNNVTSPNVTNNITNPNPNVTNNVTTPTQNVVNNITNPTPVVNVTNQQPNVNVTNANPNVKVNNSQPDVHISTETPTVQVSMPDMPTPQVSVNNPTPIINVSVPAPIVNVTMPSISAPNVSVSVPLQNQPTTPPSTPTNNMLVANVNLVKAAQKHAKKTKRVKRVAKNAVAVHRVVVKKSVKTTHDAHGTTKTMNVNVTLPTNHPKRKVAKTVDTIHVKPQFNHVHRAAVHKTVTQVVQPPVKPFVKQRELPKTGETTGQALTMIGLVLVAGSLVFPLTLKRRK